MSMAERFEARQREKEAAQAEQAQDVLAAEVRAVREQSVEQRQVVARGRASELLAALKAKHDIPDVPSLPDNVLPFRETRAVVNAADKAATREASSDFRAAEASVQTAEMGRQQLERMGAEAHRLAMGEKMAMERQGYDTKTFDMKAATARQLEKLKRQQQAS